MKTTPLNDMSTEDLFPGHIVRPGAQPRVRGYRLHDDLGRYYAFSEVLLLAMTGEIPTPQDAHAFERALIFLMDTPITSAAAHAARVTQVGRGGPTGVTAVAATTIIAEAKEEIDRAVSLLDLIEGRDNCPDETICATSTAEREAVANLRAVLPWAEIGVLAHDLALFPAIFAVFHRCGLVRPEQWLMATLQGRLTTAAAEGFGDFSRNFSTLPMRLPQIEYVGGGAK